MSQRQQLIEQLEASRGSRVLVYVTSDRTNAGGQIGEDAVRIIHEHLRTIGKTEKLDVFIYSRGGALDVPWRIATALRTFADEWRIIVPYRANSAATLLALGADEIVFGRHGELGPIDPIMNLQRQEEGTAVQDTINVEDVMAYVRFVQERVGLTDQATLASSLESLTCRLDAVSLGAAFRTHSHIRDVARRMILSRRTSPTDRTLEGIIETLAEKVYAHGHAIGADEAEEIGLPVVRAEDELDRTMWNLLGEYEGHMKLLEPIDPRKAVQGRERYTEDVSIALIETTHGTHEFRGEYEVAAKRQMPQQFNVNLNLNLQLPQGAQPIDQALQQSLQQLVQQGSQALIPHANQAVQEALKVQAPVAGLEAGLRGGSWERTDGDGPLTPNGGPSESTANGDGEASSDAG